VLLVGQFISQEITVLFAAKPGPPTAFVWNGVEYTIARVRDAQRRLDFRKPWFSRRHRDYYVVETEAGGIFEIYFQRGPGRRYWVLYKKLEE